MRWHLTLVAGLVVLGAVGGLGFYWPWGPRPEALTLPGIVEIQEVRLGPRVAGRVSDVLVTESDVVEPGQELVRLEAPELQAQRDAQQARVYQAEAELARAENGPRLQEKKAALAAVQAAQARHKRLQAGFRKEELRQVRSELEAVKADEQLALEEFDRAARLFPRNAISRTDYDNARSAVEKLRGQVASAQAKFDLLEAGYRTEEVEEAQAEVRRAQANLHLLEEGTRPEDVASARARLAEARAKLAELEVLLQETVVRAAEKAVVEVVFVRKGDLVPANQPVVRVLRAADLWVKIYVPETDLGKLRLGQQVGVTVDSHPGTKFLGKVTVIGSESEFTPRNVQSVDERRHQVFGVRIKVDDPQGTFKSGMAAEVTVPLDR